MTIRSLMAAVAIVAVVLAAIPLALRQVGALLDDVYAPARTTVHKQWSVEGAPKIILDVFDGGLWVHPGEPGTVSVTVEPYSSCKNGSTVEAEAAVKEVEVALTREDDTIQIVAKRVAQSATRCFVSTSTHLYIPPGSSVWLRTTTGSILVQGSPSEVVMENQVGAFGADFTVGPADEPKLARVPGARLEVVGGSVYAGNQSYGTVHPGDRVQFAGDGKLTVNGAERKAQ